MEGFEPPASANVVPTALIALAAVFLAGLVLLIVLLVKRKRMESSLFLALVVLSVCAMVTSAVVAFFPTVDVVTRISSGGGDSEE